MLKESDFSTEYNNRQYTLILHEIDLFIENKTDMRRLLFQLKSIFYALEKPYPNWVDCFISHFNILQSIYMGSNDKEIQVCDEGVHTTSIYDAVNIMRLDLIIQNVKVG